MNSISGMLHSVLGCQPLLVLRPTGPITLLIEKLHEVSEWLVLPFWPLFAWTGIFVGPELSQSPASTGKQNPLIRSPLHHSHAT